MRNLKKFLALILAMMMTFSLMVTVNASSFEDAEDVTDEYTDAVDVLTTLKVIKGYENADKTFDFKPKDNITRGEVAAILYRIVTSDVGDDNIHLYKYDSEFKDVYATDWYAPYINFCANNGLIKGVGDNRFNPNGNITGYEALVMILRAIGYNNPSEFTNSDWKFKASGYGARLGLTANIPAGSLGGAATREMVSEIMYKGLQAPTVSYSPLLQYTTNLLVTAGTKGHPQDANAGNDTGGNTNQAEAVVYLKDIPSTLFYEVFDVVALGEGRDNYGRPTITLLGDGEFDNLDHGTKYVAGGDVDNKTWTVEDPKEAATTADFSDDVIGDPVLYTVVRTPMHTFYNAVSECELTKTINNDKSIKWAYIDEYVNGNHVTARTGSLDATHTTVNTIGAQGRTTEVYNVDGYWTFVYYDTLLGKVTKVTPVTKDTAGHNMKDASLTVLVNSGDNGKTDSTDTSDDADVSVTLTSKANYTQKVGDLVLLTTYGMRDVVAAEDADKNANGADAKLTAVARLAATTLQDGYMTGAAATGAVTSASVPKALADFQVESPTLKADGTYETDAAKRTGFAVTLAGAPTEKTVTVTATVGNAELKTGIKADNETYMANNAYLRKTAIAEYWAKDDAADVRSLTNSKIGRSFKLYLDKHNNIMGMVESQTDNVGVITTAEPVRIGTGKWAMEIELLLPDETTKTFRLLDDKTEAGKYLYFSSQNDAESNFGGTGYNKAVDLGDLVKLSALTKDGETYWSVADCDSSVIATPDSSALTGKTLATGVTNTLDNALPGALGLLDDDTVFFVTEYDFHYNNGTLDTGANVDPSYHVYKGFKNVPTINSAATGDIVYQIMDNDGLDSVDYILVYAKDGQAAGYNQTKKASIAVDDSILVVAPVATYADYAEYSVIRNGEMGTIKVANINDGGSGLNEQIETARAANKLIWALSTNSKGYITAIATVDDIAADTTGATYGIVAAATAAANTFKVGTAKSATIPGATAATYNDKGVLTVGTTPDSYVTVAADCVVKIVNKDLNTVYDGTMDSIDQYHPGTTGDDLVVEFNSDGYASAIYIMD